jgi:hypothetical protein
MLIQVRRFIGRQPAGHAARSQGRPWRGGPEMHPDPVIRALLFDAAGTLIEPAEPVAEV